MVGAVSNESVQACASNLSIGGLQALVVLHAFIADCTSTPLPADLATLQCMQLECGSLYRIRVQLAGGRLA